MASSQGLGIQTLESSLSANASISSNQSPDSAGAKRKRASESKLYCVRSGHHPGIYHSWPECLAQVKGFKGAIFKSFTTLTDAERFLNGEDVSTSKNAKASYKFYAVRAGRVPGIYTDWPSALKQVTGWTKPQHKCFSTRAEAQRFIDFQETKAPTNVFNMGESVQGSGLQPEGSESTTKRPKKSTASASRGKNSVAHSKEAETFQYEPGVNLPPGAEDGFDSNILLGPGSGNVIIKTRRQKTATKLHSSGPTVDSMLRVYTDGSSLGNGQPGAFAGVGVYFGPSDSRNISEALPGTRQTNQRAELTAIVRALDTVPKDRALTIVTDSQYSINCATVWYKGWEEREWKTSNGKAVENRDIIENIRNKVSEREAMGIETRFEWIRGHNHHPGNMAADRLAVDGAREAARLGS